MSWCRGSDNLARLDYVSSRRRGSEWPSCHPRGYLDVFGDSIFKILDRRIHFKNIADRMMRYSSFTLLLLTFVAAATAQFGQFFQNFNGHQQDQPRRPAQNVASDSAWYQQTYSGGRCLLSSFLTRLLTSYQLHAPITSARGPLVSFQHRRHNPNPSNDIQLASPSHTTVHALGHYRKTNLNLETDLQSVCQRGGSRLERQHERLSWPGRGCCEQRWTDDL